MLRAEETPLFYLSITLILEASCANLFNISRLLSVHPSFAQITSIFYMYH